MNPSNAIISRVDAERREHELLSPLAAFSDASSGRLRAEEPDPLRTCYQRDRDRIIHCKAFRRLSHKTQVFLAPEGDHYRTRLTHTLEVSQISRSIARSLGLNEDLTEAIALGHDLGHTPFGHTGEGALSRALSLWGGIDPESEEGKKLFRHNEQSARVVDLLEKEGSGLNLTREVVDGIICHTGSQRAATLEGRIVAIADRIAYVSHDVQDAERAGLLCEEDLPKAARACLGPTVSDRISTMVRDMVTTSAAAGDILMSEPVWEAMMELRSWLYTNVYTQSDAKVEEPKANRLVEALFMYYIGHLDEVPAEYRVHDADKPQVQVADYISGMTDRYAIRDYQSHFIPRAWRR